MLCCSFTFGSFSSRFLFDIAHIFTSTSSCSPTALHFWILFTFAALMVFGAALNVFWWLHFCHGCCSVADLLLEKFPHLGALTVKEPNPSNAPLNFPLASCLTSTQLIRMILLLLCKSILEKVLSHYSPFPPGQAPALWLAPGNQLEWFEEGGSAISLPPSFLSRSLALARGKSPSNKSG